MRPRRIGRCAASVAVAVALTSAACGGDDSAGETTDEASFCRLAAQNLPVEEADAPVLVRLEELAPEEVDASVSVLRDLAEQLAEHESDSPEALALEFEVRFSDDYLDAREAVVSYLRSECREELATVDESSPDTTSTTEAEQRGDDG